MRDSRRIRLVLALLLLTAFTLVTLDYRSSGGGATGGIRDAAGAVFGPVERAVSSAVRPIGSFFSDLGHLGSNRAQIRDLQRRNDQLLQQLRTGAADRRELDSLQATLGMAGRAGFKVVAAHVVALGAVPGFEWTATIDVGTSDGISRDLTVMNGKGLVGKVVRAGRSQSTVLLAIDPRSYVGVQMADSGEVGGLRGAGDRAPTLTLLSSTAKLTTGEQIVTWGSSGDRPYVPALPVGVVESVEKTPGAPTRTATVRPYVDFTALGDVAVVVGATRTVPRTALLPTPPPPSPSATPSPPASPAPASPGTTPGTGPGTAATPGTGAASGRGR